MYEELDMKTLIDLSSFSATEDEKKKYQKEIDQFLQEVSIIEKVDTNNVPPLIAPVGTHVNLRDDIHLQFDTNKVISDAPMVEGTSYVVPPQRQNKGEEKHKEVNAPRDTDDYEAIMGLEVHVQLKSKTKIFCECSTEYGAIPNGNTCPVCSGHPGSLPVLNREVINLAIKAGLAFNCKINHESFFERKHYFYPDLPAGYQVSQLEKPLCIGGHVDIELDDGTIKRIRLNRIHVEEDAGKMVHVGAPGVWGAKASAVDFNRTSMPLIEIVTEPDIKTAKEAKEYVATLRTTLLNLGICDGNLEEGSMRCDANISVKPRDQKELGTKTEIKNMNSFKAIEKAIEHEIERQKKVIKNGGIIIQQTRLWDDAAQKTIAMRSKETAMDYRYFRDPGIAPLIVSDELINKIKKTIIPSPLERKKKYQEELKISHVEAVQLVENPPYSKYFEGVLKYYDNAKNVANWFFNEILSFVNGDVEKIHISYEDFAKFLKRIDDGEISGKIGKEVVAKAFDRKIALNDVIDSEGLKQISDTKEIENIVDKYLATVQDKIAEYKNGNEKLFGFFVGEIMKQTKGKANPKIINDLLRKKI